MRKKATLIFVVLAGVVLVCGNDPALSGAGAKTNSGPLALEYKLTGITAIRGTNQVFLVRHEADGTDRQIQLKQGEKFEDLQILDVNFKTRSVRVRYRGTEGAMNFNSHGIKAISTVEEQGDEFVRVNKKFAEEHKRAHEERFRREAAIPSPPPPVEVQEPAPEDSLRTE